ncbi:hypothetical protein AAC387_Pa07g2389 [Persea americana]
MGCIDLDFDDQGAQVHAYAIKSGCTIDISIQTALLSLYAEVGSLLFSNSLATWLDWKSTNLLSLRLLYFHFMQRLGAYDTGKSLHSYVIKVGVEDNKFVGCALIDMYANCGSMENAIHGVNPDHVVTFHTVLSSCSLSGLVDRVYRWDEAKKVREVMERKPLKEKKVGKSWIESKA